MYLVIVFITTFVYLVIVFATTCVYLVSVSTMSCVYLLVSPSLLIFLQIISQEHTSAIKKTFFLKPVQLCLLNGWMKVSIC
jgi:hypothetical protein